MRRMIVSCIYRFPMLVRSVTDRVDPYRLKKNYGEEQIHSKRPSFFVAVFVTVSFIVAQCFILASVAHQFVIVQMTHPVAGSFLCKIGFEGLLQIDARL